MAALRYMQRRLPTSLRVSQSLPLRRIANPTFTHFSTSGKNSATTSDVAKPPSPDDQFANGNNAYYAEEMYRQYKEVSFFNFDRDSATVMA